MLPKPIFPQLTQIIEYNKSTFCKFVYSSLQHLDTCNDNFLYFLSIVLFAIMWFHDIELFFVSFFVPLRFVENISLFILMHTYQKFSIIIFVHLIYHIFCLIYVLCPPSHVTFWRYIFQVKVFLFAFFILWYQSYYWNFIMVQSFLKSEKWLNKIQKYLKVQIDEMLL